MTTDFTKPVVGDGYAALIPGINQTIVDLGKMLEPTDSGTHTNIPTGTRRWNGTTNRFEKFNGSSWVENSVLYAINISGSAGNAATVTNGLYSTGAYSDPAWLTALGWSKLTGKPTSVAGYGITDAITTANIGVQSVTYATSSSYATSAGSAPANDVYTWAKQATKPSYSKSEVGLGSVDNTADSAKSVNYAATSGAAANGLGVGQTWQDLTSSRAFGGTYQNTTGRTIFVSVYGTNGGSPVFQVSADNSTWISLYQFYAGGSQVFVPIPSGYWYRTTTGGGSLTWWSELR